MTSLFKVWFQPESRKPAPPAQEVALRPVVLAGIALWAVALVVNLILAATDRSSGMGVWVSAAGLALGFAGLGWVSFRKTLS